MTIANPDNPISKELSKVRRKKVMGMKRNTKLYEAYLSHPIARYTMTFATYKRRRRKYCI